MTTEALFFDEAMKYREIARELHSVLGKNPCTCVETEEYKAHNQQMREATENMTREERTLFYIFQDDFEGEKLVSECERCRVMYLYEQAIGDEATDYETFQRLMKRNNEQAG